MPCNSDHMEPTSQEQYRQHTAQLLLFICTTLNWVTTHELKQAAKSTYCSRDYTAQLCDAINRLSADQRLLVMSDVSNKMHRELHAWWDSHKAADVQREAREKQARADDINDIATELRQFGYVDLAYELEQREAERNE